MLKKQIGKYSIRYFVQRSFAYYILGVDISPVFEKQCSHSNMAILRRERQW